MKAIALFAFLAFCHGIEGLPAELPLNPQPEESPVILPVYPDYIPEELPESFPQEFPKELAEIDTEEAEEGESKFGYCKRSLGPIKNLPYDSGKWLNIFVDRKIYCHGRVSAWKFYAKKKGQVYLSVWRPVLTSGFQIGWKRVGKNKVRVRCTGVNVVHVLPWKQIKVRPFDVLGISYPKFMIGEWPRDDRGIIPYENNEDFPWDKKSEEDERFFYKFSRIHNEQIYDHEITDEPRTGVRDFKRKAALAAYISGSKSSICQSQTCQNGGKCVIDIDEDGDVGVDYKCNCPKGFLGKNCEYEDLSLPEEEPANV